MKNVFCFLCSCINTNQLWVTFLLRFHECSDVDQFFKGRKQKMYFLHNLTDWVPGNIVLYWKAPIYTRSLITHEARGQSGRICTIHLACLTLAKVKCTSEAAAHIWNPNTQGNKGRGWSLGLAWATECEANELCHKTEELVRLNELRSYESQNWKW